MDERSVQHIPGVQEARGRFLSVLRSLFMEMYDAGNLRSHGTFRLLACVDASLDVLERPVTLWPQIRPHLASQPWLQHTMRALAAMRVPWQVTGRVVGSAVRNSVQVAAAIVQANNEAMQLMRRYDVGDLWQGSQELYFDAEMDRLLQLLRDNVVDQIAAESAVDVAGAQSYLNAVRVAFPQLVMDVQTHHSAAALLHHKAAFVGDLQRAGVVHTNTLPVYSIIMMTSIFVPGLLEEKEYGALHGCVEVRMKQLELRQPHTQLTDPLRMLADSTLLADVPPKSVAALLRACSLALVNAGDKITLGPSTCLMVAAGSLALHGQGGGAEVTPNTMLGGLAAAGGLASAASCTAATIALLVRIPAAALQVSRELSICPASCPRLGVVCSQPARGAAVLGVLWRRVCSDAGAQPMGVDGMAAHRVAVRSEQAA